MQIMQEGQDQLITPGHSGFNKQLRDRVRHALILTAILMASGYLQYALLSSAYAVYTLKVGTLLSCKNAKWMTISILSFGICLSCIILDAGARILDESRDYSFNARLRFWYLALKSGWWPILTLFLVCSWGGLSGIPTSSAEKET